MRDCADDSPSDVRNAVPGQRSCVRNPRTRTPSGEIRDHFKIQIIVHSITQLSIKEVSIINVYAQLIYMSCTGIIYK